MHRHPCMQEAPTLNFSSWHAEECLSVTGFTKACPICLRTKSQDVFKSAIAKSEIGDLLPTSARNTKLEHERSSLSAFRYLKVIIPIGQICIKTIS